MAFLIVSGATTFLLSSTVFDRVLIPSSLDSSASGIRLPPAILLARATPAFLGLGNKGYPDLILESDLFVNFFVIIISDIKQPLIKAQQPI